MEGGGWHGRPARAVRHHRRSPAGDGWLDHTGGDLGTRRCDSLGFAGDADYWVRPGSQPGWGCGEFLNIKL